MDKLERLMNLISALLETPRPLTAEELRTRVPGYPDSKVSFRRSFERDKDDLREMGVPLVLELIPGLDPPTEGYRIDRDRYYLDDPDFEPDELAALHLALGTVRLDGVDQTGALWKLGGVVDDASAPPAADALASLPSDPNLPTLFSACAERRPARFDYRGKARVLDPHRVGYQRGHWYLVGFDHGHGEERSYRVDRISGPVTVGEPGAFGPAADDEASLPGQPWRMGEGPEVRARLWVDATQASWASRQLGQPPAETRPDGSVVLSVAVTNWPAFRSFVLDFLDHAELLEPPELRAELVSWLEQIEAGAPVTRLAASARVTRMLSLVPWVAARGSAPIDEICQRFAIDREQLLRDLDAVSMVGLYPYTPDVLIELFVDEDEVHITLPQAFDRPLQLTAEQGLALVASGAVLLATPGADPNGPLARGLTKLAGALDADPSAVAVQLGDVSAPLLDTLRDAARDHHQVAIDYYAYGRDQHTHRVIDPHRVAFEQGHWYVSGWCHLADGERLFRIDRIGAAEVQADTFDPPTDAGRDAATSVFSPAPDDPRVVLELASEAVWVVETYPVDDLGEGPDGHLRVTLTISAPGWLERLLLGLGSAARVVEAPAELRGVGPAAATRVLARYRDG